MQQKLHSNTNSIFGIPWKRVCYEMLVYYSSLTIVIQYNYGVWTLKRLVHMLLQFLAFSTWKSHFIYINLPFHNSLNINALIFHITVKYYLLIYYFLSLLLYLFIFSLSSTHIHLWHHHRKCKTSSSTSTTWSIPHDLPHSNAKKNQKTSRNQKNNKSVPKNLSAIPCIQKRKRQYCKADESFSKPTTSPPTWRHLCKTTKMPR